MALFGAPGMEFSCEEYTCVLNNTFNFVIWSDLTVVINNKVESLGFIVPVHYLSFIKTVDNGYNYKTDITNIFRFKQPQDVLKLKAYVDRNSSDIQYGIITDLKRKKNRS